MYRQTLKNIASLIRLLIITDLMRKKIKFKIADQKENKQEQTVNNNNKTLYIYHPLINV